MTTIRARIDESPTVDPEEIRPILFDIIDGPTSEDGRRFSKAELFPLIALHLSAKPGARTIHCWPAVTRERARFVKFHALLSSGRI
jgi:hypothetical protein